jgi:hypothetical protein
MGPMTGGGRGFCTVPLHRTWPAYAATPGYPYYGVPSFTPGTGREEEREYLKGLARSLRADLKEIEARIQQIENQ